MININISHRVDFVNFIIKFDPLILKIDLGNTIQMLIKIFRILVGNKINFIPSICNWYIYYKLINCAEI